MKKRLDDLWDAIVCLLVVAAVFSNVCFYLTQLGEHGF